MLACVTALAVVNLVLYLTSAQAGEPTTHRGLTAEQWHFRYLKEHRALTKHGAAVRQLQGALQRMRGAYVHQTSSLEAIRLASITYGAPYSEMVAVASCESPGLVTNLRNPSSTASGLFQFLDSTWARSRYGSESVWSPYANALAAAWLWRADGRSWREWVCKP